MSELLRVFVEGDPVAQPRARAVAFAGHARMYDPGNAKPWRSRIAAALLASRSGEPALGPLELVLDFYLRRPKSHYRASGELTAKAPRHPVGRPDFDNLAKAVADELTQLSIWQDDAQVVDFGFSKRYATADGRPGVLITLRRVDA